ncbi:MULTISPECIES: ABC transporter permease [Isoptericola]|uniref:Transport permease protein n=1 Tax=Isoptericola sediminis TaxID=2733572 RepID=A0A849KG99_9MICO|nr:MULTISPECIES: ABC transporter permease [Isoptericola]MDO8143968.1 ABC transporter permease [Isoptericola sp. 178]MDO8149383.1 ABC transporter permease [Isoptericola sp. b515]MDO8152330.1 ABC transporter permease [Isoptericola sp. b408]NNU27583.1 ABC transporter permease [Isoptericola sediminis]
MTATELSTTTLREAVALEERPARPSAVSTSLTFGWRALLKIKHVPEQLFDVLVSPVIFTLMFTYLFGGALAGSTDAYIQFLLPGILVQTIIIVTVYTGYTLNTDITKGVFDRFRSLPIWRPAPIVGALLGDQVRYTIASIMCIGLGLLIGFRPAGGVLGVVAGVALLLVFAFALSWIFTILGLLLRTPNAVMGVSMMVLMPLTFASNIFVDPSTMPSGLQAFVDVNPVSHLVTAIRGLMAGVPVTGDIVTVLVSAVVMTAIFAPITMYLYRNRR